MQYINIIGQLSRKIVLSSIICHDDLERKLLVKYISDNSKVASFTRLSTGCVLST